MIYLEILKKDIRVISTTAGELVRELDPNIDHQSRQQQRALPTERLLLPVTRTPFDDVVGSDTCWADTNRIREPSRH